MAIMVSTLIGALLALFVGRNARRIGYATRLLDYPDPEGGRKLHGKVTPLVGGLAVILAALAGIACAFWPGLSGSQAHLLLWLAIIAIGMYLVGAADDRFGLTAPFRLGIAGLLLLLAIVRIPRFNISFLLFSGQEELILLPGLIGVAFTLVCLVGLLNAVNMADGKNGLVIGQALIWSAIMMFRAPEWLLPVIACLAGALCVLFVFNMRGKLFLGDSGSYCLSAIFGLLAVVVWNENFADVRADDIALIFAIPVFDTLRLIAHRLLTGKTPFTPGRDHLHHYLYARWGWPRPLPWVLALVAIPNFFAILIPDTATVWLIVTAIGYVGLLVVAGARSTRVAH